MILQGQTIIEKMIKHYDATLMWFSAACLAGSVIWVVARWSTTESVGAFNERLAVICNVIEIKAKMPESAAGSFRGALDKAEGYTLAHQENERMIFTKYIEPETGVPEHENVVVVIKPVDPNDVPTGPRFILTKTIRETLPLIWSGELRSEQGLVLYQMNTPTGTHFLREDGEVEGFKILAFEDGKLKVQKVVDQEVFYLEYKKQIQKKELLAEILDSIKQEAQTVHVGSSVGEYTVVEITDTLVRLKDRSKDQILVLELQKPKPANDPSEEVSQ